MSNFFHLMSKLNIFLEHDDGECGDLKDIYFNHRLFIISRDVSQKTWEFLEHFFSFFKCNFETGTFQTCLHKPFKGQLSLKSKNYITDFLANPDVQIVREISLLGIVYQEKSWFLKNNLNAIFYFAQPSDCSRLLSTSSANSDNHLLVNNDNHCQRLINLPTSKLCLTT